jgi:hypothetical protein
MAKQCAALGICRLKRVKDSLHLRYAQLGVGVLISM